VAEKYDYLVVGAGFAGSVLAERLAEDSGKSVLVVDRRGHIAGNAYDYVDSAGILIHAYGPHYFRTNSTKVVDYLSRFTKWHQVSYQVLVWTDGKYWQFPINLNTFEQYLGRPSTTEEMESTLAKWREDFPNPKNSEEMVLSQVGRKFYEMFFRNYTRKQWKRDPRDLDASVCGRIPVRTNRDNRFVVENFQALPNEGYTAMFQKMLHHPRITVRLNADYRNLPKEVSYDRMIYTGMIDEFYQFSEGRLPYRSMRFEPETIQKEFFQPAMQVNYPNDHEFTRVVEIKHATGQKSQVTTIVREYPEDFGPGKEAYYPIPAPDSRELYEKYAAKAKNEKKVTFVGRLATYRYYNMDQVVAMALTEYEKLKSGSSPS
jgi:UDP-galactopyranose mutase